MPNPYAFNERGNVQEIMTSNATIVCYYHMLQCDIALTRDQKNELFHLLRSNSGKSRFYKIGGVCIPFWMHLKRYWVQYGHGSIEEIYAPDKTSIRASYYTNRDIVKIVEIS